MKALTTAGTCLVQPQMFLLKVSWLDVELQRADGCPACSAAVLGSEQRWFLSAAAATQKRCTGHIGILVTSKSSRCRGVTTRTRLEPLNMACCSHCCTWR
jgi:hypothetical protein